MDRPSTAADKRVEAASLLGLVALVLIYLATVLPHLGSNPIVGGDEGWIISASARLTDDGVFGSALFKGFYDAEDRYYFNLPLHHLVVSGAFELFGVGVSQARLVSVAYGLATLLLTYALARKLGGPLVALAAAALLVLLRLNLTPFSGLTLTDLGATVRYDLITVPYGLGALLVLLQRPYAPSIGRVAIAGLLIGLAGLTQFIGAFFALPVALFLLSLGLPLRRRFLLTGVLALTMLAPLLPYGVYVLADRADFGGQSRTVEQQTDLTSPRFYLDTLRAEPHRYAISTDLHHIPKSPGDLLGRPSARLAILLVGPAAAVYMLVRGRRDARYRLIGLTLVSLIIELALFESTKRFVYWVIVVPFLCVAIADFLLAAWLWRPSVTLGRLAPAAVALVLLVFAVEGLGVAAKHVVDSGDASNYGALSLRLEATLPPGTTIVGDNRLWPALRDRDYRSLLLVFYQTNPRISRERKTDVFGAIDRIAPDYLLISPLSREILAKLTPADAADFDRYLATRTEKLDSVPDRSYGPIDVYRVRK